MHILLGQSLWLSLAFSFVLLAKPTVHAQGQNYHLSSPDFPQPITRTCRLILSKGMGPENVPQATQELLMKVLIDFQTKWELFKTLGVDPYVNGSMLARHDPNFFKELTVFTRLEHVTKMIKSWLSNEGDIRDINEGRLTFQDINEAEEMLILLQQDNHRIARSVRSSLNEILNLIDESWSSHRTAPDVDSAYIEIRMENANSEFFIPLLRDMYLRFAENRGFQTVVLASNPSQNHTSKREGITLLSLKLTGPSAYSELRYDTGVHRLMTKSKELRGATVKKGTEENVTTVRAYVTVLPLSSQSQNEANSSQEWNEKDFQFDTFRSNGPGGQHANNTDSAVRLTHIPTGIQVTISSERSQHRNRALALAIVKSKLRAAQLAESRQRHQALRSSILEQDVAPYVRGYNLKRNTVTDGRTNASSTYEKVMGQGDLNPFIDAAQFLSLNDTLSLLHERIQDQLKRIEENCRASTSPQDPEQIFICLNSEDR